MGRVALLATRATELALTDAGLLDTDLSPTARWVSRTVRRPGARARWKSTPAVTGNRSIKGIAATDYILLMSHTCAANLAQFFGIKGRIVPTCSACTSGSQGIGYGYEAIRFGRQTTR